MKHIKGGNNGTLPEQVVLQIELQQLGYNVVCCDRCDTTFIYRVGEGDFTVICPECQSRQGFSDLYPVDMIEISEF